jgi:hypothetical protein
MKWLLRSGVAAVALCGCSSDDADRRVEMPETATCDSACLIELAQGIATGARKLEATARVTENGMEMKAPDTWLGRASGVNVHAEYVAEDEGAVVVAGSGTDSDGRPTVFGLRLQHDDGETTEAELIVTHEGEVSLFPPAVPLARNDVFAEVVPAAERTPPERMIEIANAYFDGIEVDSGANVPVTDDCNRIENGVQTTNTERFSNIKCNSLEPFDYITEVRERRFPVVDEERGVVVALVAFYIPGGDYPRVVDGMMTTRHYDPRALFLIEAFKIENGKVRLIEATMRNMPLGSTMGW